MGTMKRILFACIGNAMRSQMAEGLARYLAQPGTVEVRSGGTDPAGFVHPAAIRVMQELHIDISLHASKPIDLEFAARADAVVTLCGPLDGACPRHISDRVLDWTIRDPSWGGDDEVRRVRDEIEHKITRLFREWNVLQGDRHGGT